MLEYRKIYDFTKNMQKRKKKKKSSSKNFKTMVIKYKTFDWKSIDKGK